MNIFWRGGVVAFLSLIALSLSVADDETKNFTYKQAFESGEPDVFDPLPDIAGWYDGGSYLYWQSVDDLTKSRLIKVDAKTSSETDFVDFQEVIRTLKLKGDRTPWTARTADYTRFLFNVENDLYYYSTELEEIKRLTNDEGKEANPEFSPDGSKIAFTRENDLFILDIAT